MRLWSTVCAALFLSGCANEEATNYLSGSIGELFDLSFTSTQVRLYPTELSIEYLDATRFNAVALRVTLPSAGLVEGERVPLLEGGAVGFSDSFGGELPPLEGGRVRFGAYSPTEQAEIRGRFTATFDTEAGQTLNLLGGFDTNLEVVDEF